MNFDFLAGKTYLSDTKATFVKASERCQEVGMKMATLKTNAEHNNLYHFVENNAGQGINAFVGITDLNTTGRKWYRIDDNSPVLYTIAFFPGEPDNISEHCVSVDKLPNSFIGYHDISCDIQLRFVCESLG